MTKIFSFLFEFFQGYSTSIQNRKSYASALESVNGCQLLSLHLLYIQKLSVLLVSKNSIWKKSTRQTRRAFLLLFMLCCFFFFVFLFCLRFGSLHVASGWLTSIPLALLVIASGWFPRILLAFLLFVLANGWLTSVLLAFFVIASAWFAQIRWHYVFWQWVPCTVPFVFV